MRKFRRRKHQRRKLPSRKKRRRRKPQQRKSQRRKRRSRTSQTQNLQKRKQRQKRLRQQTKSRPRRHKKKQIRYPSKSKLIGLLRRFDADVRKMLELEPDKRELQVFFQRCCNFMGKEVSNSPIHGLCASKASKSTCQAKCCRA